ncbi:PACE efflux transporter [Rhodobacter sp. ETT8]|uniref:PACE efflux transporter n=1 Tax=Pseudotabrizicola algicola TaxID=2709381 RepID=A0A6B3RNZ7_9RHOB|nr:PACE efflux transporter [Pseudotabrizicola algicola]
MALRPFPRRVLYVTLFEGLAIVLSAVLLAALSGSSAQGNLPVAIAASTVAVVWNFLYNTGFEAWERRRGFAGRSLAVRVVHTLGFEGGLVLLLIPLFMWWYGVGLLTALAMEAALLVFFLVFTFVFTWVFDILVRRIEPDLPTPRAESV